MKNESTFQNVIFHNRPITDLKFNLDGDLIFASSKDGSASMINNEGRVIGTFDPDEGSINAICPLESTVVIGSSAMIISQWDIFTGERLNKKESDGVIRSIVEKNENCYFSTDNSMNMKSHISFLDLRQKNISKIFQSLRPVTKIFSYKDSIIFGDESGFINKLDLRTNKIINEIDIHYGKVTNIKPSFCKSYFATSSSDSTVKLIDSDSFSIKKKFECEEPVNCAAIFPTNDKVVTVGGMTARDVTTTRGKSSFDTNFFDIVTSQKIGFFSTHFGTINVVDVHPTGKSYISAGEDGIISIVQPGRDFYFGGFTKFE